MSSDETAELPAIHQDAASTPSTAEPTPPEQQDDQLAQALRQLPDSPAGPAMDPASLPTSNEPSSSTADDAQPEHETEQPTTPAAVDPAQVPLPSSPLFVPSSPLPSTDPIAISSPAARPPLAPPPRSKARLSPAASGSNSPAAARTAEGSPVPPAAPAVDQSASGVAKTLSYGENDPKASVPALSDVKPAALDGQGAEDEWSTPALPSFREDATPQQQQRSTTASPSQVSSDITPAPGQTADWTAPAPPPQAAPALPPRSSSLSATTNSPSSFSPAWTLPGRPSPTPGSSSSMFLRPPPSPIIPDELATGPLPKRRSSSGVYTPASFPGPAPRKASAPAAVSRPPPLPTGAATYRKASEGTGLGFAIPTSHTSTVSPPLPAASTGSWGIWSSARSYFGSAPSTPVPSSTDPSSQALAPSPLVAEPSPTLATALFPAEDDTLLPTGSLSPAGVYTPNSFYEQQQQHLLSLRPGSTTPTVVRSPTIPTSPRLSAALKSPSTVRKPAPALGEEHEASADGAESETAAFSATVIPPAPAPARKPVPTYSHDTTDDEDDTEAADTTADSHSPPSSLGPSTPAWEQPEAPPLPSASVETAASTSAASEADKGAAGFAGFKGLGKEMQVLEVAMPLDQTQDTSSARVY